MPYVEVKAINLFDWGNVIDMAHWSKFINFPFNLGIVWSVSVLGLKWL